MNYRPGHLGGVPLCAFLLLLFGHALASAGSRLLTSESLSQAESAGSSERGAALGTLIAKPTDSDSSVDDCILIHFGVLDKGEKNTSL